MSVWSDTHSLFLQLPEASLAETDTVMDEYNTGGETAMIFEYLYGCMAFIAPKGSFPADNYRAE